MSQPLSESDILFPHQSNTPSFATTLSSLKRSALSINNRLTSITSDSEFVTSVSEAYNLPLVANERCGSWYIPLERKTESVYFKSTDGHMGEWGFSLRRLNLQLLDVVNKYGGAIVVDSTRRGKSMPDALSKTIPIWCCVINRALFGANEKHELATPPQAVSESEHAQIESRIDGCVRQFIDICNPSIPDLRAKLQKPLRPIWVTQLSTLPASPPAFTDFHPIVLCTASRRVIGAEASENGYVQGAADDHEAWSRGLTPSVFWKNKGLLLSASEEDAPELIARLVENEAQNDTHSAATLIKPTTNLYVSSSQGMNRAGFDLVISCTPDPIPATVLKEAKVQHYLHLKCQTGKLGSRDLRNELSRLITFFSSVTARPTSRILLCCPTAKDLSVGTAIAILCLYSNDIGTLDFTNARDPASIDKNFIKHRLSWITTSNPSLNPSRATLQSVNAVLLSSKDPKLTTTALPMRLKSTMATPTTNSPPSNPSGPSNPSLPDPPRIAIPENIFTSLQSTSWSFHRTLSSTLPTHPSGTVTGTATFTPCDLPNTFPSTLLYAEEGDFVTANGLRFSARRKYVYQLHPTHTDSAQQTDVKTITVKFFNDEALPRAKISDGVGPNGEGIGGLFVEMDTLTPGKHVSTASDAWGSVEEEVFEAKNKEQHLCAEDLYTASWRFGRGMTEKDGEGMWWEVRYDVKGPKKDYVSVTRYEKV
ncbi:initiator tRNA phosphoribosyl transferase-domain-containing protein [Paraphoma chrysanthemicola]|uniref:Initiator tRNA phosphoribosyl transferase-domain-containing protein n=1 Tax=Paraphoma chrysanthemicola TaxID=798071 RepID=A0A8K0R6Q0_9PLEO|nr:initiator tRNA phosphoribosyl transferase-domain-containing protein [Paraphoma chrysanthemicola]